MKIITFEKAILDSAGCNKRSLILGNGFSIACRADIFHYGSLFSKADFSSVPEVKNVFTSLKTQDFETAIHALERASLILPAYDAHGGSTATKMLDHAAALKEILVKTIASNHPSTPVDIPVENFWNCRKFLSHFLIKDQGNVYTL